MSSYLHTSRSMSAVAFELLPNSEILSGLILLKAFKLSFVSVGWWIVKEYTLFLIQGPVYNSLLELLLPCQSHCVHIHVAMSSSFIQGVRVSGAQRYAIKVVLSGETGPWLWHFSQPLQSGRQAGREVGCCCHQGGRHQDQMLRYCQSKILSSQQCGILIVNLNQERTS